MPQPEPGAQQARSQAQTEPLCLYAPGLGLEALWRLSAIKRREQQERARERERSSKQGETR